VEAAVAYNVLKFVEWPEGAPLHASPSLELCVLADPPFAAAATAELAGRSVGGRPLRVREVQAGADADAHRGCHAVFVGAVPDPERTAFLLAREGIVTFARGAGLGARGILFNFYVDGERIRFEVNLAAARRAHVRVSARLLSVARVVEEDAP
jgi:hypothetical protein